MLLLCCYCAAAAGLLLLVFNHMDNSVAGWACAWARVSPEKALQCVYYVLQYFVAHGIELNTITFVLLHTRFGRRQVASELKAAGLDVWPGSVMAV